MKIIPRILKVGSGKLFIFLRQQIENKKTEHIEKCRMGIRNSLRKHLWWPCRLLEETGSLTNWWEADKCGGWLWGKPTQHALPASGRWSWICLCGDCLPPRPTLYPSSGAGGGGGIQRPPLAYQHLPSPWLQWWLQGCVQIRENQARAPPRTAGQGGCLNGSGHTAGL